jgi:methionine synthase II (cobalamin-independent)
MPPYRSDVIGSLLRPEYLKEARKTRASGGLSHAEFKKIKDCAVDEAVDIQLKAGLDVITDGEMRRYAFFGHLIDAVEGYDKFGGGFGCDVTLRHGKHLIADHEFLHRGRAQKRTGLGPANHPDFHTHGTPPME